MKEQTTWADGERGDGARDIDEHQAGGDHYKRMAVQPWDVMELLLTAEEFAGYLKGCIIKHTMRNNSKPGESNDLEKAKHYMAKLNDFEKRVF